MRSAAQQAESGRPDTGADLAVTLAQLRAVLCRAVTSAAAARELADIGVSLLEIHASIERNTTARAVSDEWVELGRQLERAARPCRAPAAASRTRKGRQPPLLRGLPG